MTLPESERLNKHLFLGFTDAEYDMVISAASMYNLKPTEYIMSVLNGKDGIKIRKRMNSHLKHIKPTVPPLEQWDMTCEYDNNRTCVNPTTKNDKCVIKNGHFAQCPGFVRSREWH